MGNVKIKQFSDKNKELIAGLTPEHAVYDVKGVRLDAKLGNINLQEFRDLQQQCVNNINSKVVEAEAKIDAKHEEVVQLTQAAMIGSNTVGLSGTNIQENLNDAGKKLYKLEEEIYKNTPETIEWVDNLAATGGGYIKTISNVWKCSKPYLLKKNEKVTITSKGSDSYIISFVSEVNNDSPISEGQGYKKSLVLQSSNTISSYTYVAENDIYVSFCYNIDGGSLVVDRIKSSKIDNHINDKNNPHNVTAEQIGLGNVEEEIEKINNSLFVKEEKKVEWINGLVATDGSIIQNSTDKISKTITLYEGEKVTVKTKGDGSYLFSIIAKVASANFIPSVGEGATNLVRLTNNSLTQYSYTATEETYIVISVYNDSSSEVSFENLKEINKVDELTESVKDIENRCSSVLVNKSVLFFGDSLTAASTTGITGFAEIIANNCGTKYKAGLYSGQNPQTIDVAHTFYNFAKDGTTNHTVVGRTDSVVDKVKNLVNVNSAAEYILIECCVNDLASEYRNIGTKATTYTEAFDITSSLGAIEEVIRYITTLGTGIKLGFFIPWTITWGNYTEFDKYVEVFKKWCVPYLDLRDKAGFNMRDYSGHSNLYSLSSDSYTAYDDTTTYNLDDKVKYAGSLYKCLTDGIVGIPPTDQTKWMIVSSSSSDGTHLNSLGHKIVASKIQNFIESL